MEQPKKSEPVEQKKLEPPKAKKPYSAPKLTRYGNVSEMTKMIGNQGNKDNGTGNSQRTHT